jgi:hypothetical protein
MGDWLFHYCTTHQLAQLWQNQENNGKMGQQGPTCMHVESEVDDESSAVRS